MPDIRKSLDVLANEWIDCTRCELGVRRQEVGGAFVFGEGVRGGLLLVGEGPGQQEEKEGTPFIGKSGKLIRFMLHKCGIETYYLANTVACRSCSQAIDSIGRPIFFTDRRTGIQHPRIIDEAPTPSQVAACKPRLLEQIYLVDPMLIISLGGGAATALTGKSTTITKDHGKFVEIEVPGVWKNPVVTEKKKQWIRKVGGQVVAPVSQNYVRYLMMMTMHPAYILRFVKDERKYNIFSEFAKDIATAANVYKRYRYELINEASDEANLDVKEIVEYADSL